MTEARDGVEISLDSLLDVRSTVEKKPRVQSTQPENSQENTQEAPPENSTENSPENSSEKWRPETAHRKTPPEESSYNANPGLPGPGPTSRRSLRLSHCLRSLSSKRFVLRESQPQLFSDILQLRQEIEAHQNKLHMRLLIDEGSGIAELEDMAKEESSPELPLFGGRTITLSPLETAMVILLRKIRLDFNMSDSEASSFARIDRAELRERVNYLNDEAIDKRFQKVFTEAVANLVKYQILLKAENDDNFRISAVVERLLPADQVSAMQTRLKDYIQQRGKKNKVQEVEESGSDSAFGEDKDLGPLSDSGFEQKDSKGEAP